MPEVGHAGLTVRQCLAHVVGMQREPLGDVWETLDYPDRAAAGQRLQRGRAGAPRRTGSGTTRTSSTRCSARSVARLDGRDWDASLRARILDPLEMRRTTVGFDGRHARRLLRPAVHRRTRARSRRIDLRALDPCGGLASTGADLARWSAFVADPVAEVLSPDTARGDVPAADPHRPRATGPRPWASASSWSAPAQRTYVGHTGGMPGHITALFTDRDGQDRGPGADQLRDHARTSPGSRSRWPTRSPSASRSSPSRGVPAPASPPSSPTSSGVWCTEGSPFTFSVREGRLEARAPALPEHKPSSRFERVGPDLFRTVAGREEGELLRVTRDADGPCHAAELGDVPRHPRAPLAFGERP